MRCADCQDLSRQTFALRKSVSEPLRILYPRTRVNKLRLSSPIVAPPPRRRGGSPSCVQLKISNRRGRDASNRISGTFASAAKIASRRPFKDADDPMFAGRQNKPDRRRREGRVGLQLSFELRCFDLPCIPIMVSPFLVQVMVVCETAGSAMTGGQAIKGELGAPRVAGELASFGIKNLAIVFDEKEDIDFKAFPPEAKFYPRSELDHVQRRFQELKGVSAIVYVQTCAAEKRRRRKHGRFPGTGRRVFINQDICEGCGDCGVQSNCVSIVPVETEFGRK